MHKLIDYICDELEELERKADKDGKLSMAEVQYMDTLAHAKKNLLKSEEMMGEEDEYSMAGSYRGGNSYEGRGGQSRRGGSYARGGRGGSSNRGGYYSDGSYARGRGRNARRDSMGRYSSEDGYSMANEEMVSELRELMEDAPDDKTRMEFEKFIRKVEQM